MTDSELKIGMVGAGFWAAFQAAGWQELEGVRVTGIYNRTSSKAEKLSHEIGAKAFSSVEEMLDSGEINVVDIVTDVDTHRLYTEMAVERQLPVISQKPMAANLADARAMVQSATSTGVPFFVHENWRFQQPLLRLKEVLAS
jgi:D-apiose dehydrogenase